mmetsp:Transcript_111247/g.202318  ORF Transcript_111247/g.202318 Transcript_111247/m.202318 type:complete len:278 (+) Transcript_111247:3-836(+)
MWRLAQGLPKQRISASQIFLPSCFASSHSRMAPQDPIFRLEPLATPSESEPESEEEDAEEYAQVDEVNVPETAVEVNSLPCTLQSAHRLAAANTVQSVRRLRLLAKLVRRSLQSARQQAAAGVQSILTARESQATRDRRRAEEFLESINRAYDGMIRQLEASNGEDMPSTLIPKDEPDPEMSPTRCSPPPSPSRRNPSRECLDSGLDSGSSLPAAGLSADPTEDELDARRLAVWRWGRSTEGEIVAVLDDDEEDEPLSMAETEPEMEEEPPLTIQEI